MKSYDAESLVSLLKSELRRIAYQPDDFVKQTLSHAYLNETSTLAKDILQQLLKNIEIASEGNFPLCQDTGLCVFWVRIGRSISLKDINLDSIINQAVREVFKDSNMRCSIVSDPIERVNTKDNTPALIHYEFIDGDKLDISIMLKGGGSENMSAIKMLTPADGIEGVRSFVLDTVKKSGGNACPPLIVGIGIGGNLDTCAWLAKKALFKTSDSRQKTADRRQQTSGNRYEAEEEYLLNSINSLGIGTMGMGGSTTALKVSIETAPCHIASLPVAVNLECHARRVGRVVI